MSYLATRVCVTVIVVVGAITAALAEGKKSLPNYWTSQVEADCANVLPLQHSNVEPRNIEYARKQEQEVNDFFNRLREEFKKRNFEYVADASTNFLQNWPGTEDQKKCVSRLQTQSQAAHGRHASR